MTQGRMSFSIVLFSIVVATDATQTTVIDPGLGAAVPTPPTAVLIGLWVIGIIALAILWAASRR